MSTPLGGSLIIGKVMKDCLIVIGGCKFSVELIILNVKGIDTILGIDWLAANHVTLDCYGKKIIFHQPGKPKFIFCRKRAVVPIC